MTVEEMRTCWPQVTILPSSYESRDTNDLNLEKTSLKISSWTHVWHSYCFLFQSLRYTPCKFVREKWFNVTWMGVEPGHIATPPNSEPDGRGEPNDLMHLRRILEPATLIEDFPLNLKFANHDLRWPTQLRKISLNSEWVYAMSSSKSRPIWTFWLRHISPPASYRAKGS